MKDYTSTTEFNCGIDLHARQMYVCVMDPLLLSPGQRHRRQRRENQRPARCQTGQPLSSAEARMRLPTPEPFRQPSCAADLAQSDPHEFGASAPEASPQKTGAAHGPATAGEAAAAFNLNGESLGVLHRVSGPRCGPAFRGNRGAGRPGEVGLAPNSARPD